MNSPDFSLYSITNPVYLILNKGFIDGWICQITGLLNSSQFTCVACSSHHKYQFKAWSSNAITTVSRFFSSHRIYLEISLQLAHQWICVVSLKHQNLHPSPSCHILDIKSTLLPPSRLQAQKPANLALITSSILNPCPSQLPLWTESLCNAASAGIHLSAPYSQFSAPVDCTPILPF